MVLSAPLLTSSKLNLIGSLDINSSIYSSPRVTLQKLFAAPGDFGPIRVSEVPVGVYCLEGRADLTLKMQPS